jgi:hypothetical protein
VNRTQSLLFCGLILLAAGAGGGCVEGDTVAPAKISDLHFFAQADALLFSGRVSVGDTSGPTNTRVLAWTAPGDDGRNGTAAQYDLRYLRQSDLDKWGLNNGPDALRRHWSQAHELLHEPFPRKSDTLAQIFLPRVFSGEDVWFGLRTMDETGQTSPISDIAGPIRVQRLLLPVRPLPGDTVVGFGEVVAWAGDLNGDRFNDLLSGSPALGTVTISRGGATRKFISKQPNLSGVKVLRIVPEIDPSMVIAGDPAEEFGAAVTGLGRVTDDKNLDFAAGAPSLDFGATADVGAIYIFHGHQNLPEVLSASSADTIVRGIEPGGRLGVALCFSQDFNEDEGLEFAAGAPGVDGRGAVYLFKSGIKAPATAAAAIVTILGESAGDDFGAVVAVIGDVNGDGIPDLAVGAPGRDEPGLADAGAVYVFYGGGAGVVDFTGVGAGPVVIDLAVTPADVAIRGTAVNRRLGQAIAAGGNLAGNDTPAHDFVIGATDAVYVFYGGVTGTTAPFPLNGAGLEYLDTQAPARLQGAAGSGFGTALAGPGDLNHDQADDLVVSAPGADEVRVFLGPIVDAAPPDETIPAPRPGTGFGGALAAPGDINLDGFQDLFIGAPGAGEAYLSF